MGFDRCVMRLSINSSPFGDGLSCQMQIAIIDISISLPSATVFFANILVVFDLFSHSPGCVFPPKRLDAK